MEHPSQWDSPSLGRYRVQLPVGQSVGTMLCTKCKRVEHTGAAATSLPSKKRTNGVYRDRRIILNGLALGSEPESQEDGAYI